MPGKVFMRQRALSSTGTLQRWHRKRLEGFPMGTRHCAKRAIIGMAMPYAAALFRQGLTFQATHRAGWCSAATTPRQRLPRARRIAIARPHALALTVSLQLGQRYIVSPSLSAYAQPVKGLAAASAVTA